MVRKQIGLRLLGFGIRPFKFLKSQTAVLIPLILIITACTTAEAPVQEATAPAPPELPGLEPTDVVPTIPPVPTVETVEGIVLPDLGSAPEITNDVWINTDAPVTLASQQGKVVLIEFWTFG